MYPLRGVPHMTRREFLALAGGWVSSVAIGSAPYAQRPPLTPGESAAQGPADVTLHIGELTLDLAPRRGVKTIAYNGQVPGPLLRAPQGRPLVVDVVNGTKREEIVHWHGFHIPSEVDGAREEGTPPVPPNGRRRYTIEPRPTGTRWYHSHGMTGHGMTARNLEGTTYTGQFGMFIVDGDDAGSYDVEVPVLLHEWEPRFSTRLAMDIEFRYYSINGKMLGAGEPIRVRQGQRVLFRIVNASATLAHRLALAGHALHVTALDGFVVPTSRDVPVIQLGPGERVDVLVEMNQPGVWILGEVDDEQRAAGMGIVVEYAGATGTPVWRAPAPFEWDYALFAGAVTAERSTERRAFVFRETNNHRGWTINGKSYPDTAPIVVESNVRYRWIFDNQTADAHPVHLHRHAFELVKVGDNSAAGILKDVVMVPAWKQVEVDVVADNPGLSLFHCHQQLHMDNGFMAMMRYSR